MSNLCVEVLYKNISFAIDTDIGYYEHFKPVDIIEVTANRIDLIRDGKINLITVGDFYNSSIQFTVDWDMNTSTRMSIWGLIKKDFMRDITNTINRDRKLEELGI